MGRTSTHTTTSTVRRATGAIIVTLTAALLAGCGGDDDDAGSEATAEQAFEPAPDRAGDDALAISGEPAPGSQVDAADLDIGVIGTDVIIEMHVVLSSDDIERSVSSISARASALGGGVASSDIRYDSDETGDGYATLVVKVPPEGLDRLISGLGEAGTVRSINQSAQDVTEQLIDLDVRIANARQSVANVREFMDRTENLTDLVALEGELTRRQTELEQLEAQQRNLSDRVALSTVTIEVVRTESVPELADGRPDSIGDAFADGWDAFAGFAVGVAIVFAVLAPFIAAAVVVGGIVWLVMRRRNRPAPRLPASDPAQGDPDAVNDELVGASRTD